MHDLLLRTFPASRPVPAVTRFCGAVALDEIGRHQVLLDVVDGNALNPLELVIGALARASSEEIGFGPLAFPRQVPQRLTLEAFERLLNDERIGPMLALGAAVVTDRERIAPSSFAARIAGELDDRSLRRHRVADLPLAPMALEASAALRSAGWRVALAPEDLGRALLARRALSASGEQYRRALTAMISPVGDAEHAASALALHLAALRGQGRQTSCLPSAEPAGLTKPPPLPGASCACQLARIE